MERSIDQGITPKGPARTFGDLIDLHDADMYEVGKPPRRSKATVLEALKLSLDGVKIMSLDRARLINHGKRRAKQGTGPATLAIDFSFIRTVLSRAAAEEEGMVDGEPLMLRRVLLTLEKLTGGVISEHTPPTKQGGV